MEIALEEFKTCAGQSPGIGVDSFGHRVLEIGEEDFTNMRSANWGGWGGFFRPSRSADRGEDVKNMRRANCGRTILFHRIMLPLVSFRSYCARLKFAIEHWIEMAALLRPAFGSRTSQQSVELSRDSEGVLISEFAVVISNRSR